MSYSKIPTDPSQKTMQSFVKAAVMLAFLTGGGFALPTDSAQHDTNFWYPSTQPGRGPITAIGANGGYNYNGDGANGGYVGVSGGYSGSIYANGASGGDNRYGNGANGGSVSIIKREPKEDFFFPIWRPYYPSAANGPITANGANGGYNYGGDGANGGSISIGRREDDLSRRHHHHHHSSTKGTSSMGKREPKDGFSFPIWGPYYSNPVNGPISASGANGGYNYWGNGADGGSISINRREDDFFFPIFGGWNQPPANGAITAEGANGGVNYYGNGANGGRISINKREGDASAPRPAGNWNFWQWYGSKYPENAPVPEGTYPVKPVNGPIVATGQNGGVSFDGNGANGGSISVPAHNRHEVVAPGDAE